MNRRSSVVPVCQVVLPYADLLQVNIFALFLQIRFALLLIIGKTCVALAALTHSSFLSVGGPVMALVHHLTMAETQYGLLRTH